MERGTYKGLCVKGGAEVSAAWNQSLINEATLKATADNTFTVKSSTREKLHYHAE